MFRTQKTIDNFFGNQDNKSNQYKIKRYFYVSWENKFKPTVQAYWTDTKPEKVNFIEQIQCNYIKTGYYFYICGYIKDFEDKSFNLTSEKVYKNIPYLKSHLQKCIRKKDDIRAISSCYHLLKLSLNEVLRRLPIIMLEDTILHESFTTIIWLMIAITSKKFKMQKYIYEWILGIIYTLCIIDVIDVIDITEQDIITLLPIEQLNKYNDLDSNYCSLLYSMHLRIAYGGEENDIKLIKSYISLWEKRFRNKIVKINSITVRPISINVKELELDDWDLSAIDYHCNSTFLNVILKKYDDLKEEELKKMIWHNSSNINMRIKKDLYNIDSWNEIKDYVTKTQKYLLNSSY